MWDKVKAFVLSTLNKKAFPEGNLTLSAEDQSKLDKASGKEGFAEKFMADYNTKETVAANNEFLDAFMAEHGIDPAPETSTDDTPEAGANGIVDPNATLDAKVTALTAGYAKLEAQTKEQQGLIAKLEKLPEADTPEAVVQLAKNQPNLKVKHSKTHLFATTNSWDAVAKRPWNQAALEVAQGTALTEIKAETDWTNTANIEQLNSDIQDYFRKDPMTIHSTLLDGLEMKKYVTMISGVSDEYIHTSIVSGEITQSLKKNYLPKNKVKFVAEKGKVRDIQIDTEFEGYELKKLEKSYLKNFSQLGITDSNPLKERFVLYVVTEIMKRARKEDKIVMGRGVYFENPDRATPGSFMNNFDGFLKLIKDAKGVKYKPFDMGVPTETNIYDYINDFCERLPFDIRILPELQLVLSPYWKRKYNNIREDRKGRNQDYKPEMDTVDDFANIELVTYDQLEGENLIYLTTKDNEYALTDNPNEKNVLQFQKGGVNPRNIKGFGDYKLSSFIAVFGRKQYDQEANTFNDQLFFSNDVDVLTKTYIPVLENTTSPSVSRHTSLVIGEYNTQGTNITNITDATEGDIIYLRGNVDALQSTVKNNANLILADGDFVLSNGNEIVLRALAGGKFIEISRKTVNDTPVVETINITPDATTISAADGTNFATGTNTAATAITNITGAVDGEQYTITGAGGTSNATTITNGGNFFLTADVTFTDGVFLTVEYTASTGKLIEVARG